MLNLESLVAIALMTSVASMLLSCAALWPHSKDGMASIRDAILWGAFIFMLAGAATVGWKRINSTGSPMPWSPAVSQSNPYGDYSQRSLQSAQSLQPQGSQGNAKPEPLWHGGAIQPAGSVQATFQTKSRPANNALYGVDSTNSTW